MKSWGYGGLNRPPRAPAVHLGGAWTVRGDKPDASSGLAVHSGFVSYLTTRRVWKQKLQRHVLGCR